MSDVAEFSQIKEKLEKVVAKQHELSEKWDRHWEVLQQREYTCTFTSLQSNLRNIEKCNLLLNRIFT